MTTLAIVGALVLGFFVWLVMRAKSPSKQQASELGPSEANQTLDLILDEQEKTNELLRQLIRAYGHEPEA